MSKPNIDIPSGFAEIGTKEDFPNDKIVNGFDPINPDILPGDCLNKFIDDTYKGLNGVLELYEGCVLYDSTVTYTDKSLVFDITNDGIKFYHSLQNGNINNPLTDTDYWEEVNLGGSSRNVGEIISSTLPLTDAGLHLLDGSLILGGGIYQGFVDYIADLYAANPNANYFTTEALWQQSVNTYGVCGKFVYDSVNNTVRLPKITGIIEGTTDVSALGDLVEAGLPNITGQAQFYGQVLQSASGAFTRTTLGTSGDPMYTTSNTYKRLDLNASLSNPIYGNSSTVQPQTIKVLYYIVVATTSKTEIQSDIDEIATDLNGKLDTDGSNAPSKLSSALLSRFVPDYTNGISQTLTTSYQSYTCPTDGVVVIGGSISNNASNAALKINGVNVGYGFNNNSGSYNIGVNAEFIVGKGDICQFKTQVTGGAFYFYPMKGAN